MATLELVRAVERALTRKNIDGATYFDTLNAAVKELAERSRQEPYLKEPLLRITQAYMNVYHTDHKRHVHTDSAIVAYAPLTFGYGNASPDECKKVGDAIIADIKKGSSPSWQLDCCRDALKLWASDSPLREQVVAIMGGKVPQGPTPSQDQPFDLAAESILGKAVSSLVQAATRAATADITKKGGWRYALAYATIYPD
jgi:hypothetical protein